MSRASQRSRSQGNGQGNGDKGAAFQVASRQQFIGPQIVPGRTIRSNVQQLKPNQNEVGFNLTGAVLQRLNALLNTPEGKQYQIDNQVSKFAADANASIVATRVPLTANRYTAGEVVLPFSQQHFQMARQNSSVGMPKVVNPTTPGGRTSRILVGGPEYRNIIKAYLNGVPFANGNGQASVLNLIKQGYQLGLGPQLQMDGLELKLPSGAASNDWNSATDFVATNPSRSGKGNFRLSNVKAKFQQFTPQFRIAAGAKGFKSLVLQHPEMFEGFGSVLQGKTGGGPLPKSTIQVVDSRGRIRNRQTTGIRRSPQFSYPTDYWNAWGTTQPSVWGVADASGNVAPPANAQDQYAAGFGCSPLNSGLGVSDEFHLNPTQRVHRSKRVTNSTRFGARTPPYGTNLANTQRQYASVNPAVCRATPEELINPANAPGIADIIRAGGGDPNQWTQQAQQNNQAAGNRGRQSAFFTGQAFQDNYVVQPEDLVSTRAQSRRQTTGLSGLRQQQSRQFASLV